MQVTLCEVSKYLSFFVLSTDRKKISKMHAYSDILRKLPHKESVLNQKSYRKKILSLLPKSLVVLSDITRDISERYTKFQSLFFYWIHMI